MSGRDQSKERLAAGRSRFEPEAAGGPAPAGGLRHQATVPKKSFNHKAVLGDSSKDTASAEPLEAKKELLESRYQKVVLKHQEVCGREDY